MDRQVLDLINLFYLVSFVTLLSLAILRISKRYIDYKREDEQIPLILKRDFFFLSGLALPFLGILIFRAFDIVPQDEKWFPFWVIGSGAFALAGILYWVYIEYFKIEQ